MADEHVHDDESKKGLKPVDEEALLRSIGVQPDMRRAVETARRDLMSEKGGLEVTLDELGQETRLHPGDPGPIDAKHQAHRDLRDTEAELNSLPPESPQG